ncbi:uncharacterized protein LOC121736358 [Aricia agestis]|uniref:uncharacterized protein LOC121736358 n=1 Tax=Aricia agestis TaxID=91739 RepID=UPI001C202C22|nr:uncharacterized protein LOC121736358 [Aricia agestis]
MSNPSQSRPYQGYPYSEPAFIVAPSISADEANRWQHLPRRPVKPMQPGSSSSKDTLTVTKNGEKTEERPVIYINIPEDEGTASASAEERQIEIAAISEPAQISRQKEDEPVVYIDIPETTNARPAEGASRSHFVEETIFYDPFENRRIDVNKSDRSGGEGDSTPDSPASLRLPTYTVESISQDRQSPHSSIPPLMSKEAYIYAQQPPVDDGLRLSPLPVSSPSEYPDSPPAYTEVDERRQTELPRTQVVVSESAVVARENANRKLILCPYCGRRVLTLVVRESGILTHVLGTIFLFACFPLTICIYCTDWCKYRNHYCPQCNNLIAYEVPILCQDMVYNKV